MSSIIRTDHLTMTYGVNTPFEKVAVNDLNIEIMEGEFLGIIGHTGSGKSTLVQMLNGLITPTTGKVPYLLGQKHYLYIQFLQKVGIQDTEKPFQPENELP